MPCAWLRGSEGQEMVRVIFVFMAAQFCVACATQSGTSEAAWWRPNYTAEQFSRDTVRCGQLANSLVGSVRPRNLREMRKKIALRQQLRHSCLEELGYTRRGAQDTRAGGQPGGPNTRRPRSVPPQNEAPQPATHRT